MTENEAKAIKWIKNVRDDAVITLDHIQNNEPNVSPMLYEGRKQKAETILEMCEELEQYRAIGTVEECKTAYVRGYNQGTIDRAEELQKCREYGYNNAIDDFVEACDNQFIAMFGQRYIDMRDIVNIAEQLKVGGRE